MALWRWPLSQGIYRGDKSFLLNCLVGDDAPLFEAIRGRSWVLHAAAALVTSANAMANLFVTVTMRGHEGRPAYLAPVIQAAIGSRVDVTLRGLSLACVPGTTPLAQRARWTRSGC